MSGPGLGRFQAVLSSLRAAAFSGPASSTSGRLQLTITQPADEGGEAQSLLRSGSSLGGGVGSPRGAAAGAPPDAGLQQQQGQQAHDAGGDADADLVAAAEQHRLTSLQSSVDLRAVALGLERGLPYVTLLMFLFISLHVVGLAAFAYLTYVLWRLNAVVRRQVALKADRQRHMLLGAAGVAAAHVALALVLLQPMDMAGNMVLMGSVRPTQFWGTIFTVVVCDTLLRYLSLMAKIAVLLAARTDTPSSVRRCGQLLTASEYLFACYRQLPPTPLWYTFFNEAAASALLGTGLSGAFLLIKGQQVFERAVLAALALRQVAARHGTTATADEVQEAGGTCPICQEAYRDPLRVQCGHARGGSRRGAPLLEAVPANGGDCRFSRALGSVDYHTREAGLAALTAWLAARSQLEELDLLKLWKGIFYCFWHSDKSAVQSALAERLSDIMTQLPEEVGWLYYRTFVRTMRREWVGIDRLRLDKFMLLIRKFFAAALRQLQACSWQERRVARLADFVLHEIMVPGDTLVSAGVASHLTDLLLPELSKCVAEGGAAAPSDITLHALLDPFCQALAATTNPALIYRLRQGVFSPLVEEVAQGGEDGALRRLDAGELAEHMFALGAKPETRARNRVALYAVSGELEKAAAKRVQRRQQESKGSKAARAGAGKRAEAPHQQQQQHAADAAPQEQQAATPTPASGKKGKKRRQAEADGDAVTPQQGQQPRPEQLQELLRAAGEQQAAKEAAQAAAQAADLLATSGKKKKKKESKRSRLGAAEAEAAARGGTADVPQREQELLAAVVAAVTGGAALTPGASPSKKSVRFSLKRNLVNVIGQPPKPADVRTPPTAKPKGPALKRESAFGGPASAPERLLTRAGMGRMAKVQSYMNGRAADAPGSASQAEGKSGGKKQKRRASMPAPGSFSRPRASEFF
ncbi:Ribosomal RNA processing 1 B [Micractinium conductrix]|uniref:Ribosomal RNA processing 1 B n=1 Tax=Micractinium conductrix TaxID=554055 RepID=A0A2P6VEX2_9CHLO|nr:Ribosomal RNA processing 1 B [Micractinium conductrix]|eukprot:PSC72643.1 Ribosomal RNA processing 1 B [Micractinium conductrix]